jgi:hypothetical protein
MNQIELEEISFLLREHAACLNSDVELAATREEHVRLSARANEAENISARLNTVIISILAAQ